MRKILTSLLLLSLAFICRAQDYATANAVEGTTIIRHKGYTTCYSHETFCPVWVGWELTSDETWGEHSRTDEFTCDPGMNGSQATTFDYSRSGYDRGHMAPAADMKWSATAMEESFYMTNVCPQDNGLNAGMWLKLEKKCRYWAKCYGKVWIICGPVFRSGKAPRYIGKENRVRVPDAFFKAVLKQHTDGTFEAIAFVMDNADLGDTGDVRGYVADLSEVERLTGLSLFNELPEKSAVHIRKGQNTKYWRW